MVSLEIECTAGPFELSHAGATADDARNASAILPDSHTQRSVLVAAKKVVHAVADIVSTDNVRAVFSAEVLVDDCPCGRNVPFFLHHTVNRVCTNIGEPMHTRREQSVIADAFVVIDIQVNSKQQTISSLEQSV